MTSSKLFRTSYLLLIFGGILSMVYPYFFHVKTPIGGALVLIGWVGVHLRQSPKVGWLGHLSLGLILLTSILPLFLAPSSGPFNLPFLAMSLGQLAGIVIYGLATYQARVLPKVVAYLLILTIPAVFFLGLGLDFLSILVGAFLFFKTDRYEAAPAVEEPAAGEGNR